MTFTTFLKNTVRELPALFRIYLVLEDARRALLRPLWTRNAKRFQQTLITLEQEMELPFFVKVGANDGLTGDPCAELLVKSSKWTGVLIEPVPYLAERLRQNFSDNCRFSIEQLAIGTPGRMPFYFVDPVAATRLPDLPTWYDQLGSFDRSHIVKQLQGKLEPYIVNRDVEVVSLTEVLRRYVAKDFGLLHVDTEGHDLAVITTLDFDVYLPIIIYVEHKHLGVDGRRSLRGMLLKNGYSVYNCEDDFFALRKDWRQAMKSARGNEQ